MALAQSGGQRRRRLTVDDVQAITGQNVQTGDLDALVDALESHTAYANVHDAAYPGDEIRGQLHFAEQKN